jgi:hypothetical protein
MAATDKNKMIVSETFWECIQEISNNISALTQTTTGKDINYFEILKQRLDTYLTVMQQNPDTQQNPADIIGPVFAAACNCKDNAIAILVGTKMFTLTLGSVKEYLNAISIEDVKLN